MTARQRLVPLGICAVFAVGVTYYTFQPALAKDREERLAYDITASAFSIFNADFMVKESGAP